MSIGKNLALALLALSGSSAFAQSLPAVVPLSPGNNGGQYILKQYIAGQNVSPSVLASCGIFTSSGQMIYENAVDNYDAQGDTFSFSTTLSPLSLGGSILNAIANISSLKTGCTNDLPFTGYWLVHADGTAKAIKFICSVGGNQTDNSRDAIAGFIDSACPGQMPTVQQ